MLLEVLLAGQMTWNIPLLIGLIFVLVGYLLILNRFMRRNTLFKPFIYAFLGLSLIYLAIGSPLRAISHLSFITHMIQMSVLYFIIPPILLLSIPAEIYNKQMRLPVIHTINKLFLSPIIALYIFAVLFLIYHLPAILNVLSQHPPIHHGYIWLMFALSIRMWWPIVAPSPRQPHRLATKKRYASLSGMVLMPACILFILTAFIDDVQNPFHNQMALQLCIPGQSGMMNFLPIPSNSKYDQIMAGTVMMGIHKMAILLTVRLGDSNVK